MIRNILLSLFSLFVTLFVSAQENYYIWQGGTAYQFDATKTDSIDFDAPKETMFSLGGTGFIVIEQGGIATLDFQSVPAVLLQDVVWTSSDNNIAVVANGVVFAKNVGVATITAESNGMKSQRTVIVKDMTSGLESISFADTTISLNTYELRQLMPVIVPSSIPASGVKWSSLDKSVADVVNGVVVAKAAGTSVVTAKLGKLSASVEVNVSSPVSSITSDVKKLRVSVGDSIALSSLGVRLSSGTQSEVSYSVLEEDIAEIAGGYLVAKSRGTTLLTASIGAESIGIKVEAYIGKYELVALNSEVTMQMGEVLPLSQFGISVSPADAEYDPIVWSLEGTSAMISAESVVAIMPGRVTLTATSGEKSVSITVNIKLKATEITALNALDMVEGNSMDTSALQVRVLPVGTTDSIKLSSSDNSVVTISGGMISALKEGSCDITAMAGDLSVEIAVNVKPFARQLTFNTDSIKIASVNTLGINVVNALGVKVFPANAAQNVADCIWTVSDESIAKIVFKEGKPYVVPVAEEGETKIVATLGTLSDTAVVRVFVATSSINFDSDPLVMAEGDVLPLSELNLVVLPQNSSAKVKWTSSNEEVFILDNDNVVAKKRGTAKLIATSGDLSDALDVTVFIPVDTITLAKDEIELFTGEGGLSVSTLGMAYLPANADDADVTWLSENPGVAKIKTVLGNITILPVSVGETNVVVKAGRKQASVKVVVKASVESVNIVPDTIIIPKNEERDLSLYELEILPANASYDKVEWSIANTEIAEITSENKINAKKSGETTISATINGKTDVAKLIVKVDVASVTLNTEALTKEIGESFGVNSLEPVVLPLDATFQTIEWSSSNTDVAEIKTVLGSQVIKCIGGGTATISAKCGEQVAVLKLTVVVPVASVSFEESVVKVNNDSSLNVSSIGLIISPSSATDKNVEWKIENTDIASLDSESGSIKGLVAGTTSLTATVGGKSATVPFKVVSPLTGLNFTEESYSVFVDESLTLDKLVTVAPEDASDFELVWTVSDPEVAEVVTAESSKQTVLKPKKSGELMLSCSFGSVEATAKVSVLIPLKAIGLGMEAIDVKKGETIDIEDLQIVFTPDSASNKSLVWTSADESIVKVELMEETGEYVIKAVDGGSTTLTASQGDLSASVTVNVTVEAEDIVVPSELVDMALGSQLSPADLNISVVPENTANKIVSYTSSDDNVVKVVSVFGTTIITAKSLGESTITATCGDVTKEFVIKVMIPLDSISIDTTSISLGAGKTFAVSDLGIAFMPDTATYQELAWVSTDEAVATVTNDSIVGIAEGSATLTGTTKEGKSVSVDVAVFIMLDTITLSKDTVEIPKGNTLDLIEDLELSLVPENATYKELTWTSSDSAVAIVEEGKIKTIDFGTCTLSATNAEGVSVSVVVEVVGRAKSIEVSVTDIDMFLTQSFDVSLIEVKVVPEELLDEVGITFKLADTTIASIKDNILRAEAGGETILKVSCEGKTAPVRINVSDRITYKNKNDIEFTMIIVDGGQYKMGATGDSVSVAPFMIAETEFTVGLWKGYASTPSNGGGNDNVPVSNASEANVKKVINDLTSDIKSNIDMPYESRFTLPTEIQWEWAARGGKKSQGYVYAGSDILNEVAWTSSNISSKQPVKTLAPNELGIYDMSGNVSERCANDNATEEENLDENGNLNYGKIIRGGSISYAGGFLGLGAIRVPATDCEVSKRVSDSGTNRLRGFRIVMPVLPFPAVITELK